MCPILSEPVGYGHVKTAGGWGSGMGVVCCGVQAIYQVGSVSLWAIWNPIFETCRRMSSGRSGDHILKPRRKKLRWHCIRTSKTGIGEGGWRKREWNVGMWPRRKSWTGFRECSKHLVQVLTQRELKLRWMLILGCGKNRCVFLICWVGIGNAEMKGIRSLNREMAFQVVRSGKRYTMYVVHIDLRQTYSTFTYIVHLHILHFHIVSLVT